MTTRRDLLRRLGLTAALTAGMSALTVVFPEVANAACKATGCKGRPGVKQGQYCGNCVMADGSGYVVTAKRVPDHGYELAPDGSCCDYGYLADCGGYTARCGPRTKPFVPKRKR
ncbi:hypothetical protein [Nocardia fusca]|uniref:Secreted protein n=1 Tax=Nocardia fusca TaxID=941183 RepID=A0ABV3FKE0_9NOCA